MMPAVVAHSRFARSQLWPRHRVIVRGRRAGNGRGRLGHCGSGGALDLAPEIARVRGRFREHARGVLELRARHVVAPEDHSPARVLHRDIERAVALHPPKLPQRAHECRIRHSETGRAASSTAARENTDEGDTHCQSGAYHAARLGSARGKVNAAPCGRFVDKNRVSRQHTDSAWEPGLPIRHSVRVLYLQCSITQRVTFTLIMYLSI